MSSADPFSPLSLAHGPPLANRFVLAPLTNLQSHDDGRLGDDEFRWLTMRAEGGFGLTMTCAAFVASEGKGFRGQLGVASDDHLPGLERLARAIRAAGSVSSVQLHDAGRRSPRELTGVQPRAPWDDGETGARALSTAEVEAVVENYVLAATRAERSGFDGVELHGAHGYLIGQFLDAEHNRRDDRFGGSFENRCRVLFDVIAGVRARTGPDFQLGVRLSPERFGIPLAEARALAERVMTCGQVDYLDMSMWDTFKEPEETAHKGKTLLEHFVSLPRGRTRLGVAGKLATAESVRACLEQGADFAVIGRAAIIHHDFPGQVRRDPGFASLPRPVSRARLRSEGVGEVFLGYLSTQFKGFVAAEP